jgi:hypothetical protein
LFQLQRLLDEAADSDRRLSRAAGYQQCCCCSKWCASRLLKPVVPVAAAAGDGRSSECQQEATRSHKQSSALEERSRLLEPGQLNTTIFIMLVSIRCRRWVDAVSALAVVMLGRDLSLAWAAPCINGSVTLLKLLLCGTLLLRATARPAEHSYYLTLLSASLSPASKLSGNPGCWLPAVPARAALGDMTGHLSDTAICRIFITS